MDWTMRVKPKITVPDEFWSQDTMTIEGVENPYIKMLEDLWITDQALKGNPGAILQYFKKVLEEQSLTEMKEE